jgi:hypothetical protein
MTRPRRPAESCFHGVRPEDCHQCSPPAPRPPGEPRGFHGPARAPQTAQDGAGGANGNGHGPRIVPLGRDAWASLAARVARLARPGVSDPAMARQLGVSEYRVWRARRHLGIPSGFPACGRPGQFRERGEAEAVRLGFPAAAWTGMHRSILTMLREGPLTLAEVGTRLNRPPALMGRRKFPAVPGDVNLRLRQLERARLVVRRGAGLRAVVALAEAPKETTP